jgi:hypothetical protein
MHFKIEPSEFRDLIREVVHEVLGTIDWPQGRLALTEVEAAAAVGLRRHALRDLRLSGRLKSRKLGKRILYCRSDLLEALAAIDQQNGLNKGASAATQFRTRQ